MYVFVARNVSLATNPTFQIAAALSSNRGHFKDQVAQQTEAFYGLTKVYDKSSQVAKAQQLAFEQAFVYQVTVSMRPLTAVLTSCS